VARIRFETTVDELIDAHLRWWKDTHAGRVRRRRGILRIAATFTLSLFVAAFVAAGSAAQNIIPLAALAVVVGGAFWPLYGWLYNAGLGRHIRQAVRDQVGQDEAWTCEIELRPEGAWSRSRGVESLFDWRELTAVKETGDAIALHFRQGFVVAPSKAFATTADREEFLKTARGRLPPER
jgi:hypothetical protein